MQTLPENNSQSVFEQILRAMNDAGKFKVAVLASGDGLPIAAVPAPAEFDANTVAAMVTLVKEFVEQTRLRLGLDTVDEVAMVLGDGSQLVCRYFYVAGRWFILAIIAPRERTYRRLTTIAVNEIRAALGTA
ncbi:MAG: hypothetical protein HY868_13780 [Chloroflexi bacterium]|nr:hypothetical protein [Chloroflexota bacterium]